MRELAEVDPICIGGLISYGVTTLNALRENVSFEKVCSVMQASRYAMPAVEFIILTCDKKTVESNVAMTYVFVHLFLPLCGSLSLSLAHPL